MAVDVVVVVTLHLQVRPRPGGRAARPQLHVQSVNVPTICRGRQGRLATIPIAPTAESVTTRWDGQVAAGDADRQIGRESAGRREERHRGRSDAERRTRRGGPLLEMASSARTLLRPDTAHWGRSVTAANRSAAGTRLGPESGFRLEL